MRSKLASLGTRVVTPVAAPVHQIMFSLEPRVSPPAAAEAIRARAGGAPYRLWALEDARTFIRDTYAAEVVAAFDALRPLAYKADLARYCILNYYGGLYVDLSVTGFVGFAVGDNAFVGFRDPNSQSTSWKVGNHMFFSTPKSPILEACIAECVENVRQRFYGKDPHFPTGPSVLGRAVANASLDQPILMGDFWWLRRRRNKYTLPGQGVVARGKVGGRFLGGVSGVPGGNNYNEMWRDKVVYE